MFVHLSHLWRICIPIHAKNEVVQGRSDKHRKDHVLLCLGYRDSAVRLNSLHLVCLCWQIIGGLLRRHQPPIACHMKQQADKKSYL